MYKLIVISVILLSIAEFSSGQKLRCDKEGLKKLDDLTQEMAMFGATTRRYPTNDREVRQFCRTNKEHEKYMADYGTQCLDKLSQQIIGLLSYSVASTNRRHCSGRRKKAFMKWANCGNTAKNETAQCWRTLNTLMPRVTRAPNKWKIPMVCCIYFGWKECTLEAYRQFGTKVCPESSVTGFESFIDSYAIDVLRLMCGDYTEDSDKCISVMKKIPKAQKNEPTYNSPLNPFVRILKSVD